MDFTEFNRAAWNNIGQSRRWFDPVDDATIAAARQGRWSLRLTATKPVPDHWICSVADKRVLCLAGGGGHQGPILAAAGGIVTVFDLSAAQLAIDREVAGRNGLEISTVEGDMRDLSCFDAASFDLIVNPCSTNFCPDVLPVWRECHRVLVEAGELIAGMIQPVNFLFDAGELEKGQFVVRHQIPYSDWDLPEDERERTLGPERPIDFGHSLTDLIGGQLAAGFHLAEMFEDRWGGEDALSDRICTFVATRAIKCNG
ncbi:MAG: class I SAM-dependent methyltransferase [Pirellulaceae bacterium]|nr:class I SAM-dependent methyltransferase [Pirellulaceae bacterium]